MPGCNGGKTNVPATHPAIYAREIESATATMASATRKFSCYDALVRWRFPVLDCRCYSVSIRILDVFGVCVS